MNRPWIVKLGGSLATSPAALADWLQILSAYGGGRVVIVPGGGRFADAVRQAQQEWDFNDTIAHHMALLAMVQYGLMLGGIKSNFIPADHPEAIDAALQANQIPVWLPVPMALQDDNMEASWRVTSDSLALWLAQRLQAECMILIKSVSIAAADLKIQQLVTDKVVDELFYQYSQQSDCPICYLGPDQQQELQQALQQNDYNKLNIVQCYPLPDLSPC